MSRLSRWRHRRKARPMMVDAVGDMVDAVRPSLERMPIVEGVIVFYIGLDTDLDQAYEAYRFNVNLDTTEAVLESALDSSFEWSDIRG